jgi:hypothetical protein
LAGTLVQILIAHADGVFAGPNGDYPAVLESLEGIHADRAAWKPGQDNNSIWQIVDHLAASNIWEIEMLAKGQATPPVWTEPPGGEPAWQASLARLRETHAQLVAVLASLTEDQLMAIPTPEWKKTLFELLLSSAAHEACHAGQIDYLKNLKVYQVR